MTNAINGFLAAQQMRMQQNAFAERQQDRQRAQGQENSFMKAQQALAGGDRDAARSLAAGSGVDGYAAIQQQIAGLDDAQREAALRRARQLGGIAATAVQELPDDQIDGWVREQAGAYGVELPDLGRPFSRVDLQGFVANAEAMAGELGSYLERNPRVRTQGRDEALVTREGGVDSLSLNPIGQQNMSIAQQNADTAAAREARQSREAGAGAEWVTLSPEQAEGMGFAAGDVVQQNRRTGQVTRRSQDRPPRTFNQQQVISAEFANRMIAADQNVERIYRRGFQGNEITRGDIPLVGGLIRGEDERQYDQAVDDFITAVLRRESGAAISQSEFDTAYRTYFPSIGDGPETIAQKQALRRRAIENMMAGSQGAFEEMFGDPRQPAPAEAENGAVPPGIDPVDWQYMTPEERALFGG